MTAQAGAVAVLHRNDAGQIYWTTSVPLPELPLGVYVPVEALEGLVAKWREDADDMHASAMRAQKRGDMEAMYCNLDAAKDARGYADELTQLIKERSNG